MIASLLLAAALAGQFERPPTVRYVSLPDSYAPDLAPGEVLVPGSVYDVVRVSTSAVQPAPPAAVPPSSQARTIPYPSAAAPSGGCYASSYAPTAMAYPAPSPQVTYVMPSCPGGSCGRTIQSTPWQATPQYSEPVPTARPGRRPRERMAFGLGLTSEWETRRRNEVHLGRYDSRSAVFSPERWTGSRGR